MPYCPQFNGIELLWGALKYRFRKLLIEKKIKLERINLEPIIKQLIHDLDTEHIITWARMGIEEMKREMEKS